jgi:glycosyltransferase involved in cell wall biosynthesis
MRPWRHLTRAAAPLEELLDKPAADAKERREGFGLVVFEALWKETPVVGGRAGGIPMQVPPGFERYLVDRVASCAE